MQVSFVIPLFNCLPLTQAMVASLQASLPPGLTHEIILVDDGSTDGTREWLATLSAPFRVVLNERNLGYAVSNNRGAALAQGELLALLNNDLVLAPGWLDPMLAAHRQLGARAGLIGNVQHAIATSAVDHAGMFLNVKGKLEHIRTPVSPLTRWLHPIRSSLAVTGACVLLDLALWQQLEGFDERYLNGSEDVDLCFRATAAGRMNAVALRSIVLHHVSASPTRKARDEENTRRFTLRWRHELTRLIDRGWCWRYLESDWSGSRDPAQSTAAGQMLAYVLHLRRTPPPAATQALNAALDAELARWDEMFAP
ncbi:MAG: glycosyltransferase family 2 protein [Opitutaceae bacterium]